MRHSIALSLVVMLAVIHVGVAAEPNRQNQQRRGRITFEQFSTRHDTNKDGKVERGEFKGAPQWFRWLDQNGDSTVTAEEFKKRTQRDGRQQQGGGRRVPDGVKAIRDLEYATVDGQSLKLDLYLPEKSGTKSPLLVWIHGGGWTKGSKSQFNPIFVRLTAEGYAAASIDYRLDGLTSHPKQIHDCKGAIRWLRANADKYRYDVTRIGAGGGSAGGHLVLLLGLSTGVEQLEGDVGGNSMKRGRGYEQDNRRKAERPEEAGSPRHERRADRVWLRCFGIHRIGQRANRGHRPRHRARWRQLCDLRGNGSLLSGYGHTKRTAQSIQSQLKEAIEPENSDLASLLSAKLAERERQAG